MLRNNSFRIRFTTGTFTYPILLVVMAVLWMLPDITNLSLWGGLGIVGLTSYLLEELNNRNALIRVRSRMTSTSFLLFFMACPSLHEWSVALIPMLCLVLSYFQFFATYQKKRPEGNVFMGFLFLGIASWFYPPLLFFAIALYIGLLIPLRVLTWRSWLAGMFGLIIPFWFQAGWAIWNEQLNTSFQPFLSAFQFGTPDFSGLPFEVKIWLGLAFLTTICSIIHYSYTAFNDKIRTRMYYYVIFSVEAFIIAAICLQPQSYKILSGLLIANSTPIVAHYFTLGKSRILDYWFLVCLCLWSALIILNTFNLWTLL